MVIGPVCSKQFQAFANETALAIHVRHFPPGTSKWNAIEHELFRAISIHGRGRLLETFETVVPCIGHTRTRKGGTGPAESDEHTYETGRPGDDATFHAPNIERHPFHGEGNYIVRPTTQT